MTRSGPELDAERVLALFQELSDLLDARGLQAQLFVVGGAAMALAYDGDRVTRDVDALLIPAAQVRQIAEEIGVAHGLEPDWLNDAAKGFLPGTDEHSRTVFESESLLVQVPSPEYLLAMKLHAARDERDLDDAVTLFNTLGYTSAQECIDLLATTCSPRPTHRDSCCPGTGTSRKRSPIVPKLSMPATRRRVCRCHRTHRMPSPANRSGIASRNRTPMTPGVHASDPAAAVRDARSSQFVTDH